MTCIVGVEHEGKVFIGGDSAGVDSTSYSIHIRSDEKVFVRNAKETVAGTTINENTNSMIMGFTSSFRMGQLLRYSLKIPNHDPRRTDMNYLVDPFTDAVRKCFKEGGFGSSGEEDDVGGTFLLGYKGKLYIVYGDYQVGHVVDGYAACGCGVDLALGSMHTTNELDMNPGLRLEKALDAAVRFSAGVEKPYTILSV